MGRPVWQPPETVSFKDDDGNKIELPWYEFFEEMANTGKSTITIAKILKISRMTLHKQVTSDPKLKHILDNAVKNWPYMLKQKAVERAMQDDAPPAILIFLLKSMAGLTEDLDKQAQQKKNLEKEKQVLVPAMTKQEALKKVKELQKRQAEDVSKEA